MGLHRAQDVVEEPHRPNHMSAFVKHALGPVPQGCVGDLSARGHPLIGKVFQDLRRPNDWHVSSFTDPGDSVDVGVPKGGVLSVGAAVKLARTSSSQDFQSSIRPPTSKNCELDVSNFLIIHKKRLDLPENRGINVAETSNL
jgi:hypothetical protein